MDYERKLEDVWTDAIVVNGLLCWIVKCEKEAAAKCKSEWEVWRK